ncbi:SH3-domain-containing protein [Rhizodiscina lignyota]|uniref:SH3-domain-containing protein n=1 Tax=Rhizodiscina lignyota TaxID=1504668 RepID=A0A9P4IJL1_9PEZI|nr:SH3-domain-containing protein [Rhizodiscina lignyota]
MGYEEFSTAMTNRSLRTIKTELVFLTESSIISESQLENILKELPTESDTIIHPTQPTPTPAAAMSNLSLQNTKNSYNEKQEYEAPQGPPPSYPAYPTPPPTAAALCHATALYAYNPTDAGDLALIPNDRVAVTEYMNAEWWKGSNERTGQEGIFPRSYVKVEEKSTGALATPQQAFGGPVQNQNQGTSYGNMPLEVANGTQQGEQSKLGGGKAQEAGKKIGKKLGNAAIFGAGATIGSNIVNGIF